MQFLSNWNQFRDDSAGLHFFASTAALACYRVSRIIGFVEDLVMGDDPEYHWTDSFRASRVSNEERQNLLYALSGRLRRQIGLKVIALGGNAVVAYRQEMTFEGVKGNIVVRGYGTACHLRRHAANLTALSLAPSSATATPDGASPDGTPRDSPRQSFSSSMPPLGSSDKSAAASTASSAAFASASPLQPADALTGFGEPAPTPRTTSNALRSAVSSVNALLRETTFGEHPSARPTPLVSSSSGGSLAPTALATIDVAGDDGSRRAGTPSETSNRHLRQSLPVYSSETSVLGRGAMTTSEGGALVTPPVDIVAEAGSMSSRALATSGGGLPTSVDSSASSSFIGTGTALPGVASTASPTTLTAASGAPSGESAAPSSGAGAAPSESDVALLTLDAFPDAVGVTLVGALSARSVKIYTSHTTREQRDTWWSELRDEIKIQARTLGCSFVIGYRETTAIQANEELVLLSALGTAARVFPRAAASSQADSPAGGLDAPTGESSTYRPLPALPSGVVPFDCRIVHAPFAADVAPPSFRLSPCAVCNQAMVPSILLATVEPPPNLPTVGVGMLIEARVCRAKKDAKDDVNAMIVSDALPFLEYELYRQLLYKLRIAGMNAAFSLSMSLSVANSFIVGIASCTAVHLAALPPPAPLQVQRHFGLHEADSGPKQLQLQVHLEALSEKNCRRVSRARSRLLRAVRAATGPRRSRRRRADSSDESTDASATSSSSSSSSSSTSTTTSSSSSSSSSSSDSTTSSLAPMLPSSSQLRRLERAERSTSSDSSTSTSATMPASPRRSDSDSVKSAHSPADADNDADHPDDSSSLPTVVAPAAASSSISRGQSTIVPPPASILVSSSSSSSASSSSSSSSSESALAARSRKSENKLRDEDDNADDADNDVDDKLELSESDDSGGRRTRRRRARGGAAKTPAKVTERSLSPKNTESFGGSGDRSSPLVQSLLTMSSSPPPPTAQQQQWALSLVDDVRTDSPRGGGGDDGGDFVGGERAPPIADDEFAVQIDDDVDEDTLTVLLDPPFPPGFALSCADSLPGARLVGHLQQATVMRRVRWSNVPAHRLNSQLASLIRDVHQGLFFRLRHLKPCVIVHVETRVQLYDADTVEVIFTGVAARSAPNTVLPIDIENAYARARGQLRRFKKATSSAATSAATATPVRNKARKKKRSQRMTDSREEPMFALDDVGDGEAGAKRVVRRRRGVRSERRAARSAAAAPKTPEVFPPAPADVPASPFVRLEQQSLRNVEMTSMSFVPGAVAVRSLGRLNVHLIKESTSLRDDGGLGAFNSTVLVELNALARAYVRAMGGNALLGYHMDVCHIYESGSHETAYALFSLSGDVFLILQQQQQQGDGEGGAANANANASQSNNLMMMSMMATAATNQQSQNNDSNNVDNVINDVVGNSVSKRRESVDDKEE